MACPPWRRADRCRPYREGASFGRSTAAAGGGVSLSGFRTAGVPNADEIYGNKQPDGFDAYSVNLNGRVQAGDRSSTLWKHGFRYVQSGEEYDIFSDPRVVFDTTARNQIQGGSGFIGAQIKDVLGFDQDLRVDLMSIDRQYFGQFPFGARGSEQQVFRWDATRQTQHWGLQFGYEHKRAAEDTGDGLAVRSADGAFAIGRWTPDDRFNATVSLRQDDPQGYQGQTTGAHRRGLPEPRLAVFPCSGFGGPGLLKAPSLYETTYPCFECATPGPAKGLKAERALGEDAALDWASGDGAIGGRLTVFGLSVDQQIDYIYPLGYLNLSKVNSAGVEASGRARLGAGFKAFARSHSPLYPGDRRLRHGPAAAHTPRFRFRIAGLAGRQNAGGDRLSRPGRCAGRVRRRAQAVPDRLCVTAS